METNVIPQEFKRYRIIAFEFKSGNWEPHWHTYVRANDIAQAFLIASAWLPHETERVEVLEDKQ